VTWCPTVVSANPVWRARQSADRSSRRESERCEPFRMPNNLHPQKQGSHHISHKQSVSSACIRLGIAQGSTSIELSDNRDIVSMIKVWQRRIERNTYQELRSWSEEALVAGLCPHRSTELCTLSISRGFRGVSDVRVRLGESVSFAR